MFSGRPSASVSACAYPSAAAARADDERGVRLTERALAARRPSQDRGQRLAGHRLHRKEVPVLVVPHLDDARDVRVVEQRADARLVEKHPHELIVRR